MSPQRRPIFRQRALQHYIQKREKDILPRFASPLLLLWLWLFLLQLTLIGLLIFTVPLPAYTTIPGIILPATANSQRQATIALFLPQQVKQTLRVGETLQVKLNAKEAPLPARITTIAPANSQPADLKKQFALTDDAIAALGTPVRVIQATITTSPATPAQENSAITARIQVAPQPLLSF
ncbi:hypothetical protein [Dictyobacter formicarum]|uniref:Uncharacterized protein n=1 Tax=Dictyobacter formicarum TaxID=2778368 RepID=A0ABQ3VGC7_9CHLR|nr:hypothetical protein [Dictyobacter formicarum]GHO84982.1 hypothetical protein KSZ_29880 [Dictyobacter formicarum]